MSDKEIDELMNNLYKRCLGRINSGNSCKLMYVQFIFSSGGIGIDYYIYPFEKSKYKEDVKYLNEDSDTVSFTVKSVMNLEKIINSKEDLDNNFDLLYNKYLYN
jgi:hypothetical protein